MPVSSKWSLSLRFLHHKPCIHPCSPLYALHAPPISTFSDCILYKFYFFWLLYFYCTLCTTIHIQNYTYTYSCFMLNIEFQVASVQVEQTCSMW
jgi:hypothetical protein